jgi:hypothetical protein
MSDYEYALTIWIRFYGPRRVRCTRAQWEEAYALAAARAEQVVFLGDEPISTTQIEWVPRPR